MTGRWLFDASTLTSTLAPCRFLWKNRAREKLDLELSGLRGRNVVSLTSSSESILVRLKATSLLTPSVFSLLLFLAFWLRTDKPIRHKLKGSSGEISFNQVLESCTTIHVDSVTKYPSGLSLQVCFKRSKGTSSS